MPAFDIAETEAKTATLIQLKFDVPKDYAQKLATAALNGIASHGLDPEDWETVTKTVEVVVAAWLKDGSHQ